MSDNITLPREVVKLALDHIEWYIENERGGRFAEVREAAEALRTALAAEPPKQEPVRCNPAAMRTTASSPAVLFITELDPPALAAPRPEPSGYAYRSADGVLRLNDGSQFNGGWPVEAVPYWFATPALAAEPTKPSDDVEALRRDAERYRWMTEDHPENETRRRVYSVTLLFNAHRKEHIDAAIDAAMEPATEPAIGATGES